MNVTNDRRGAYGAARPAFTVHRFKRSIVLMLNEEMAEELNEVLLANEDSVQGSGQQIAPHLYEFASQLQDSLDQPVPIKGEKPVMKAITSVEGEPNQNPPKVRHGVKAAS